MVFKKSGLGLGLTGLGLSLAGLGLTGLGLQQLRGFGLGLVT